MNPNKKAREVRDARDETRRVELQSQQIAQLLDRNRELESTVNSLGTAAQQQAHTATVTANTVQQLISAPSFSQLHPLPQALSMPRRRRTPPLILDAARHPLHHHCRRT